MKYVFLYLFLIATSYSIAQSLTVRVVDSSNNPIPYATVQTGDNSGVITNEEGYFSVYIENLESNELILSCMGFATQTFSIDNIKNNNNIVVLIEHINELGQVYLSNTAPDADWIIQQVNSKLHLNYKDEDLDIKFFNRKTAYVDFNKFDVQITKVSGLRKKQLQGINHSLDSLTNSVINSNIIFFQDYLGNLMVENKKSVKLKVDKATQLIDKNRDFSLDNVQVKAQELILKYLDTTHTYKLKTGIIKIEDSLSLNSKDEKKEEKNDDFTTSHLRSESHSMLKDAQTYDYSFMKKLINPELYKYEFLDATNYNGELVYVIGFKPRKAKSKYSGKLYITDESFAVIKSDYEFAKGKRGEKINLRLILGVKYVEDINMGTIIFEKHPDGFYSPKYVKEEEGHYFYIHRPIKFIENSKAKRKTGFDFVIEGSAKARSEFYVLENNTLDKASFYSYTEPKNIPYQKLDKYDPSIWSSYNAIEPLEEMKRFKSTEN